MRNEGKCEALRDAARKIAGLTGEQALLEQLLEECGELVQAAAKRLRILRSESPTPVSEEGNFYALREEMADVALCIEVLGAKLGASVDCAEKAERWLSRLAARDGGK